MKQGIPSESSLLKPRNLLLPTLHRSTNVAGIPRQGWPHRDAPTPTLTPWQNLPEKSRIGVDATLVSYGETKSIGTRYMTY